MTSLANEWSGNNMINKIIFLFIGLYCLLCSIFYRPFAHLHIQLPFFDFPVFISEILLAVCLFLLLIQRHNIFSLKDLTFGHASVMTYTAWVLFRAFDGYLAYGPLAFRNAALFYYPLFAAIGYTIYQRKLFKQRTCIFLLIMMFLAKVTGNVQGYYIFPYFVLMIILARKIQVSWMFYPLVMYIIIILTYPQEIFFTGGRARLVGHILAFLFLSCTIPFVFLKRKNIYKIIIAIFTVIFLVFGIYRFADKNAIKSMTNTSEFMKIFTGNIDRIEQKTEKFEFKQISPQLYSKEIYGLTDILKQRIAKAGKISRSDLVRLKYVPKVKIRKKHHRQPEKSKYRNLSEAYNNICFRLFIWRDMFVELFREKSLLGMNWGKPQRSKSIEILTWAEIEWSRDGWITPHNSFLHFIYRAGLIGVVMVMGIFAAVIGLIRKFVMMRSLTGILLMSIFVYWVTIANFLVFLEFPYAAIPFWTLLGMTSAYYDKEAK